MDYETGYHELFAQVTRLERERAVRLHVHESESNRHVAKRAGLEARIQRLQDHWDRSISEVSAARRTVVEVCNERDELSERIDSKDGAIAKVLRERNAADLELAVVSAERDELIEVNADLWAALRDKNVELAQKTARIGSLQVTIEALHATVYGLQATLDGRQP